MTGIIYLMIPDKETGRRIENEREKWTDVGIPSPGNSFGSCWRILEAYTFFCRGGVFANCQTGNLVMFALSAADGDGENMVLYLIPVVAFVVGIFLAEWIRQIFSHYQKIHWRQIIILFEIVCLAVTAFIPGEN